MVYQKPVRLKNTILIRENLKYSDKNLFLCTAIKKTNLLT